MTKHTHVLITEPDLMGLPEYSTSYPTGTTIGKRWRRDVHFRTGKPPKWIVGTYVKVDAPGKVGIQWLWPLIMSEKPALASAGSAK